MKKQLLTLAILVGSVMASQAQLTLTKTLPPIGATKEMKRITNANTLTKLTKGADQTWDMSTATLTSMFTYSYPNFASLSQAIRDSFPTTDYCEMLASGAPDINLNPFDFYEDKADHILRIGNKSSGSSMERKNDTLFLFSHAYDSTVFYRGSNITYIGYGSLAIDSKTFDSVALFAYVNPANTADTTFRVFQFAPFFAELIAYNVVADTIQNAFYYSIGLGTPTSVKESVVASAKLYPNPATDKFEVVLNSKIDRASVMVYDVQGKLVATQEMVNTNQVIIETSTFNKGVYFVKVVSDNQSSTQKLIKQ